MPTVPTTEPESLYAGETWAWTKHLTDFPASTYTLKYALRSEGPPLITLTASASGTDFAISVAASVTASYAPGEYIWVSYAEAGSARYQVESGRLTVLPNLLATLGVSPAAQILALIRMALVGRIPNGLENTSIDGQTLSRMSITQLAELETRYEFKAAAEKNRAAIAAGLPNRRNVFAHFTSVR